jgi:type I restriction enzyme, R subunit
MRDWPTRTRPGGPKFSTFRRSFGCDCLVITGSDAEGQAQLGNFIDPEAKYPVLVTTSRLLSTGVDTQTCRLILLDRSVGSMTEFKQIVGRGTRVHEDTKKFYFTLIDFRGATHHFADPDFDGEPVQIYEPNQDDPIVPPDDVPPGENGEPVPGRARFRPGKDVHSMSQQPV